MDAPRPVLGPTRSESLFLASLVGLSLPLPVRELRFHPVRRWRFDFAWPASLLALEVQGGIWRKGGGAHQRSGHLRDMEKLNEATCLGWRVLQVAPRDLGGAAWLVKRCLVRRDACPACSSGS